MDDRAFKSLIDYLERIPAIVGKIGSGTHRDSVWWVKFKLDTNHPLGWNAVQELAHVLNYLSVDERLPTTFYPVSPPPYMNGGPDDFLSWVIENKDADMRPGTVQKWLEGRLPQPVDEPAAWAENEE